MPNNENFKVIFRRTGKDSCGNPRYEFEVMLESRPYSTFDFALSENGERITMGSKHFQELPLELQNMIANEAWKLVLR